MTDLAQRLEDEALFGEDPDVGFPKETRALLREAATALRMHEQFFAAWKEEEADLHRQIEIHKNLREEAERQVNEAIRETVAVSERLDRTQEWLDRFQGDYAAASLRLFAAEQWMKHALNAHVDECTECVRHAEVLNSIPRPETTPENALGRTEPLVQP